ncbi:MAG: folate-binding protein [Burkholderiales bacterium]|nr:MAG: folate-binding protein [Burkholderiales bacterium]
MSTLASPPAWTADAVERLALDVGGSLHVDGWGPAISIGTDRLPDGAFAAPLSDLGLLSVSGEQGRAFLHAQLTNDVEHLAPGTARWAGYCTAKGRLLSTFRYWCDPTAVLLTVSRPLAQPIARRLSMFVLRAKAKVADASDAHALFGLCGDPAAAAAAAAFGLSVPTADGAVSAEGVHLVGLPPLPAGEGSAERGRWLLVVPAAQAAQAWQALDAAVTAVSGAAWRRSEVMAGIPRIVPGTSELFVPQMLNFESVDGVNFRKGCYPGQEIVARSQYLGKLKRRMFAAHGDGAPPEPGSDVVPGGGGEPCGQVVLAAPDGAGGFDLLFESQVAAAEAGPVLADGRALAPRALPYVLKAID